LLGRVIRLLAGFYFVQLADREVRCRARGRLRLDQGGPCVGDMVEIAILPDGEGVITEVLPRRNLLERPPVANVTQVLVVCAAAAPPPNLPLIDRVLVAAEWLGLSAVVVVNKCDLDTREDVSDIYRKAGYLAPVISLSERKNTEQLYNALCGHTTVLAGQSGVGKSSVLKHLCPARNVGIGEVNMRKGYGRHTTRHVELIFVPKFDAFVVDTPGFSKLELPAGLSSLALADCFLEMRGQRDLCRFGYDCRHLGEPDCAVKRKVETGDISLERYESYVSLLNELFERERSQYK